MTGRQLRIVLVCEAAGGGVGKHVLDVAESLPSLGFDVLLVHSVRRAEPQFAARLAQHTRHGYRVATVDVGRAPGPRDVAGVLQLRRAVREFGGADVLHGHSSKGGALARLARWGCARRVFYTAHGFYAQAPSLPSAVRRLYGFAEHALALATDQVIAVSNEEKQVARTLGIPERKLAVVENGIWLRDDAELARDRATARAALGLTDAEVVIGFVGRLAPPKTPELAVETFGRIRRSHANARFILVGDGPQAPEVSEALAAHGVAGATTWLRDAVGRDMLPAMDVLLVTSQYEGFPYVMLEALDAGCAIVTTPVGGARDCVVHGRNGAIVNEPTPDAFSTAVEQFIESPDALRAARTVSRTHAHNFEIERMINRLATLYRNAVDDAA
ncbi:MAG TPA: glycosyltransferase [Gemmatimonadaceae bacterium]|jgi:glycosyltransferase involved in cell wall biosynthesis|nr:glycosyltransferase [Gemmatimonadaceae bacterium]